MKKTLLTASLLALTGIAFVVPTASSNTKVVKNGDGTATVTHTVNAVDYEAELVIELGKMQDAKGQLSSRKAEVESMLDSWGKELVKLDDEIADLDKAIAKTQNIIDKLK